MAFAAKLVNRRVILEACTPLLESEFEKEYKEIQEIMAPAVKEITLGTGEHTIKIGGKLVLYRHEFTYHNPPPIAIDVTDEMSEDELLKKVKATEDFTYTYIGKEVNLDMIAIRSTSNDPTTYRLAVERVFRATNMPLILCSFDPNVLEAGLVIAQKRRPLIYAANSDNWKDMAELALMYNCPLTVFAPNDLNLLRSLTKTLIEYGVKDLVLDPGTFTDEGISKTINNFTMIRRNATKETDSYMGFPLIGTPINAWIGEDAPEEVLAWKEAYVASMLISRYADILITHSIDGWVQLPLVIWRFNLYTDPRKPVAVDPGLKILGEPDENSPVMLTANYALTYFTVESDIKSADIDSYLLVADTEGMSVESGVAGRYLTAEKIAETIKASEIEKKVKHKNIIIPGMAARLSGETEELSGWNVLVGPRDSSGIPKFLKDKWPPKK
jgi:acetyl-CoA decarbonylase/synthase complex subunit gamma